MSTREDEILKKAKDKVDLQVNPFAVSGTLGASEEVEVEVEDGVNPFALTGPLQPELDPGVRETAGRRFAKGVGEGLMHPVRAFRPDEEPGEVTESGGVAGAIGEFAGAGLTFIPLFKGSAALLKGVGLVRSATVLGRNVRYLAPFGRSVASLRGAAAAQGSLAFGGFEAFAGEDVSEAPVRFVKGLAEGAAFEVGMAGVASAWRARLPKWKPSDGVTLPRPVVEPSVAVHPLALKLENATQLFGNVESLKAVGDPQRQLYESFVGLMEVHMPAGQLLLPGLTQKEITQLFKTTSQLDRRAGITTGGLQRKVPRAIELVPFRRIKGEDLFDVLVIDPNKSVLTPKHLAGKASIDEVFAVVKDKFGDTLGVEFPPIVRDQHGRSVAGLYIPKWWDDAAQVKVATNTQKFREGKGVSTFIHEIVHHLEFVRTERRQGIDFNLNPSKPPTLENFFRISQKRGEFGLPSEFREVKREQRLVAIREQLKVATEEVIAINKMTGWNEPDDVARASAKQWIEGDASYFHSDVELVSRMAELIFLDPLKAKALAPMASKLVGGMIQQEIPNLRQLMSRESNVILDMIDDLWRFHGDDLKTVWTKGTPTVTPTMKKEFTRWGWAPGLRASLDGIEHEFIGRIGKTQAKIRNLTTGEEVLADMARLQRPVLQTVASRTREVMTAVEKMLDVRPNTIPINLLDVSIEGNAIRRALVDVREYEVIKTSVLDWIKGLPQETQERLVAKFGQLKVGEIGELRAEGPNFEAQTALLDEVLDILGKKGLVRDDEGLIELYVRDPATVTQSSITETAEFGAQISGTTLGEEGIMKPGGIGRDVVDRVLIPDSDEVLKHKLRTEGVNEADLLYFFGIAKERFGNRLRIAVSSEVRQVDENVKAALKEASEDATEDVVARAGLERQTLSDGRIELRDNQSKSVVASVSDESHAREYAREMGAENSGPDLGDFATGSGHGGNSLPPKHGQSPIPPNSPFKPSSDKDGLFARTVDAFTIFAPWASALENFAKAAERRGLGPAYTQVYLPAHTAMLQVQRELSDVARDSLGGLTFKDKLQAISKGMTKVSKARQPTVTGHIEALTRGEIAQEGGLMTRAMTSNELRISKFITDTGLENDVPRLMSANRLINAALGGKLSQQINRMRGMELSPEAQQLLGYFESLPKFENREAVLDFLGFTKEERQLVKILDEAKKGADKDKFSIYAVSRHASAPELKKGFKDGRAQFAFENKMTGEELNVSKLVSETLEAGFADSGLDAKRHISGYWPHMQRWTKEGFVPQDMDLPIEVSEWMAKRYRSGELNVYDTDPMLVTYRHLRGLYMNRHFDPVMDGVNAARQTIRSQDQRVHDVMSEFVNELMGKPHASFEKAQAAVASLSKVMLGKDIGETLVNDIVSGLSAIASAAVIPFRPNLIVRNFFESVLKVAPRTGVSHYYRGLQYVVNRETRIEAFNAAMNSGAIRPATQRLRSLHSAEEMFGPTGPAYVQKYLQVFDKGFEWYQSADDWGRAIAYHAQRFRVMDNLDDFNRGRISMAQLKDRAKVNTFDPIDAALFEREITNGNFDGAVDHLGKVLANETMTRYGYADHPAGWNSVTGRLFGQFGTWPVQYKDYLLQGVTRGSSKDKAEFAMIHGGISGGIIAAGASVGLNLTSYTGMSFYTGGPYADVAIDMVKSINGSESEKALARYNLYSQIPVLGWIETGNPRSIFLPGSYLLGDLGDMKSALEDDAIYEGVMSGLGVRVIRPGGKNPLDFIYERF